MPSDSEIFQVRLFAEPLVPVGGRTSGKENRALAVALKAYERAGQAEAVQPLVTFLNRHPKSAWRVALLANLGSLYRRNGYFTRALAAWEEAWRLGKSETERQGKAIVEGALAQLAELNARLGRYDRLDQIFHEIDSRPIGGSAGEILYRVREGRAFMEVEPGLAFRCGPAALESIYAFTRPLASPNSHLTKARSTKEGTSLLQILDLARVAELDLRMSQRIGDATIPLPAVVHWKAGHFAALLESSGNLYRAEDPTFDGSFWVTRDALNEESSGYFLIPANAVPEGWAPIEEGQAAQVWGKGWAYNIEAQTPDEPDTCRCPNGNCGKGMAGYSFKLLNIGLRVFDTPVGYAPPVGPPVHFEADYNQRDPFQPGNFTYSNLGPKWTFTWLSYIEDNPSNPSADVNLYARGGGQSIYTGMADGVSDINTRNQAVLHRTATSPITYERRLPDGSVEVFAQPFGASPRKVFMTEWKDPMGNRVLFGYDTSFSLLRLITVTDAIDQVTTLHYDLPSPDQAKITRVTDPFGRTATFSYDVNGRLQQIVDVIWLTSAFGYDSSDFLNSLQTPYGTTTFTTGFIPPTGNNYAGVRWLEALDPLQGKERVEFAQGTSTGLADQLSLLIVPQGMPTNNYFLSFRNSFYWDKRAMASYSPTDPNRYKNAHIYHWLHWKPGPPDANWQRAIGVLESEKKPLESRVWYTYPNQPSAPTYEGSIARPTAVGRVLDDPNPSDSEPGPTQIYRYEYNLSGKVCKTIDPLLRETRFTYGTNNNPDGACTTGSSIDLLKVEQMNGANPEVLETRTYNSQHQLLTVTDASGQTTTYTYTTQGQVLTVTTPPRAGISENRTTTYTYDANGYLQSIQGPGGDLTSFTYDAYGRVRTVTPNEGDVLTYSYDALDRIEQIVFPDLSSEHFNYNYASLNLDELGDRLGRVTKWSYDQLGRVKSVHEDFTGINRTTQYIWCSCGSLDKVIDPNGNETTWDRDLQGRVRFETRDDGHSWEYTYEDTTSRLKERKDAKQQVTRYQYFLDDKPQQVSYTNTQVATPTVSFTYDSVYGRLATMTDGSGLTSYSYHPISPPTLGATRLSSVDGPLATDLIAYTYDELGRVKTRGLSAAPISFTYDHMGRVTAAEGTVGTFNYTFTGSSFRPSTLTYPNGQVTEYDSFIADPRRGLKYNSITHRAPGGAVLLRFDGYAYDLESNIVAYSTSTKTHTLTYDELDQVTAASVTPPPSSYAYAYDLAANRTSDGAYNNRNQLTSGQGITYTYDPNGNLASSQPPTGRLTYFEWNAENRLVRILWGSSEKARFKYDGFGRRVQKVASGVTRDYVYDEERLVEERFASTTQRFVDAPGIDQHLAQSIVGGSVTYLLPDHLGNIHRETNNAGTITLTREYDPYGNMLQGGTAGGHAFTGREWDPETGLYYYRARYYDPKTGRFISEDPIGLLGGVNFYAYVSNSPTTTVDPTGEAAAAPLVVGAIFVGAIILTAIVTAQMSRNPPQFPRPAPADPPLWPDLPPRRSTGNKTPPPPTPVPIPPLWPHPPTQECKPNEEQCAKEWAEAYETCRDLLSRPNPPRGITGGYTNIRDCARGLVSQECGGNAI